MTDCTANHAMDSRHSQQALASAGRAFITDLLRLLPGDFQQWITDSGNEGHFSSHTS